MFVIFLLLGFNNAHSGLLENCGAEYPMTGWNAVEPVGSLKTEGQETIRDCVPEISVEPDEEDEVLNFALSTAGNGKTSFIFQEGSSDSGVPSRRLLDWIRTATYDDAADTANTAQRVDDRSDSSVAFESEYNLVFNSFQRELFESYLIFSQLSQADRAAIARWLAEQKGTVKDGSYKDILDDGIKLAAPIPNTVWLLVCGLIGLVALRRKFKN